MAGKSLEKGNVRLILQRSHPMLRIALLGMLVLCILSMVALGILIQTTRQETAALREQALELQEQNQKLQDYLEQLGSVEAIQRIAQEELGLYLPDTIIYHTK
ncbi:MAG TPA: septum formation initiator family protein [Candidatus Faecousia intestinigallinarum]|nr:septum formation initiator family protein [Candidatus Faecousia intestinigallinarum]